STASVADAGHFFAGADDHQFAGGSAASKFRDGAHKPGYAFPTIKGADETQNRFSTESELRGKGFGAGDWRKFLHVDSVRHVEKFCGICFSLFEFIEDRVGDSHDRIGAMHDVVLELLAQAIAERESAGFVLVDGGILPK